MRFPSASHPQTNPSASNRPSYPTFHVSAGKPEVAREQTILALRTHSFSIQRLDPEEKSYPEELGPVEAAMRLHGMIGDHVKVTPEGKGWRPPDYITNPTFENTGHLPPNAYRSSTQRATDAHWRMSPQVQYRDDAGRFLRLSRRVRKAVRGDATLPAPSTRYMRLPPRLTFWQRLFAICVSTLVALSLLGCLVTLFSEKLDVLEAEMEIQNSMSSNPSNPHVKPHVSSHSSGARKLSAIQESHGAQQENALLSVAMNKWNILRKEYDTASKVVRLLSTTNGPAVVASVIGGMSATRKLRRSLLATSLPISKASLPALTNLNAIRAGNSEQKPPNSFHHESATRGKTGADSPSMLTANTGNNVNSGHRTIPPLTGAFLPLVPVVESSTLSAAPLKTQRGPSLVERRNAKSLHVVDEPNEIGNPMIRNLLKPQATGLQRPLAPIKAQSGDVLNSLYSPSRTSNGAKGSSNSIAPASIQPWTSIPKSPAAGLFVPPPVMNAASGANPYRTQAERMPPKTRPRQVGGIAHSSQTDQGQVAEPIEPSTRSIEVFQLMNGTSICRLFAVCRMPNGTLLLPKWMETHKHVLKKSCGVKDVLFVVDDSLENSISLDSTVLRQFVSGHVQVDHQHADRDLFGIIPPRDHMPHFASDIVPYLTMVQSLFGPAKGILKTDTIRAFAQKGGSIRQPRRPSDLRPSMQLYEETIERPSTDWVPSLARFLQHPSFRFSFIRAEKERLSNENPRPLVAKHFRSILTSSVQPITPHGMFGADGQNIVFSANGVSRDPPWFGGAMRQQPCPVTITALTRRGPRALMKLPELERRLTSLGMQMGMALTFRIVDFASTPFQMQVHIMQTTNVLIASHGAGNANIIFMRPSSSVVEVFPFSYKAGPFDGFANIYGAEYKSAMSAPQTEVFKECVKRSEKNELVKKQVFAQWDKAVEQDRKSPGVHRLAFEREFGAQGKSQGMATRRCARMQELVFDVNSVASMALQSAQVQCMAARHGISNALKSHYSSGPPVR